MVSDQTECLLPSRKYFKFPRALKPALVALTTIITACATQPRDNITPLSKDGVWSAKTLVKDKKKNKTHQLDLDFVAQGQRRMRMEVTTPGLGVHIASFVLNGETMTYILPRQKRYVTGSATPKSLRELISIEIAPEDLVDLLFDRTLSESRWNCKLSEKAELERCVDKNSGEVSIVWSERAADKRMIDLESSLGKVTMSLKESSSKVQINDEVFTLSAPDGFKTQRLD